MLTIGYVRQLDAMGHGEVADLEAAGCQVVRVEPPEGNEVLTSILDFIGPGDQLVVTRLERLAGSGRGLLAALDQVEARGASFRVLAPEFDSQGAAGRALRAVLESIAAGEPTDGSRSRRRATSAHDIAALHRAGVGPVEIARRLGVSRMTVWRKLRSTTPTGV